jgi:phenylpropionate dioxygenase-like ring-hydroxylating dioxygenase large terminal subunit
MSQFNTWQPHCLSRDVGRKPVAGRLGDEELVAFRTPSNGVTVLQDRCPHRGMRLSRGAVRNERLVCPYHGWAFDAEGRGTSLGSPGKTICARKLDATEELGVVWIKSAGADAAPLQIGFDGFHLLHRAFRDVDVPVELMLDNFTEIEHTGTGHWEFGFDGSQTFKEATFFTSLGAAGCRLTAFYYWTRPSVGPMGLDRLFRAAVGRFIEYEIDLDINLVRGLADSAGDLKQCQLTRFDGVVVQNRRVLA